MKRVLSILLVCTMMLSLVALNVFALSADSYSMTITADVTDDVKAGDSVYFEVILNTTEGVYAANPLVKYDPELFDCGDAINYDSENEEFVNFGCLDEDWWDEFSGLKAAKRINNNTTQFNQNITNGLVGANFVKGANAVTTANKTEDMVILAFTLTAKADIPDGTRVALEDPTNPNYDKGYGKSSISAAVSGKTTTVYLNSGYVEFSASALAPTAEPTAVPTAEPTAVPTAEPTAVPTAEPTAVPTAEPTAVPTAEPTAVPTAEPTAVPTAEPTAVPTEAPTEAPAIVADDVTENTVYTSNDVAAKAFTAFAKLDNIDNFTVEEFGIYFLASDDEITEDSVKNGTAYPAMGKLDDGSYSVRLVNGDGTVDYFDKANAGFISYMKIAGEIIFGAFKSLK